MWLVRGTLRSHSFGGGVVRRGNRCHGLDATCKRTVQKERSWPRWEESSKCKCSYDRNAWVLFEQGLFSFLFFSFCFSLICDRVNNPHREQQTIPQGQTSKLPPKSFLTWRDRRCRPVAGHQAGPGQVLRVPCAALQACKRACPVSFAAMRALEAPPCLFFCVRVLVCSFM